LRTGRSSRTAEHNALFRDLEMTRGRKSIIDDPFAGRFLTWPLSALGRVAEVPGCGRVLSMAIDRRWPGVRTSVVARTRLIDDTLCGLSPDQLGQFVILGAGFDSRPYRILRLREVPVFEVDHPDTQRVKREVLQRALPALPANVTFVSTDFNLVRLDAEMAASGYRSSARTTFLWEGVTNYLTEEAVDATVRWCAKAATDSLLLFTYVHTDAIVHPERFRGAQRLQETLQKVDERLTFGMDPDDMADYLAERGFEREWDLGAAEYRARYFGDRSRTMVGHEFYRLALARRSANPDRGPDTDLPATHEQF
jgi:methyltransferase (TIGR00027 family)